MFPFVTYANDVEDLNKKIQDNPDITQDHLYQKLKVLQTQLPTLKWTVHHHTFKVNIHSNRDFLLQYKYEF